MSECNCNEGGICHPCYDSVCDQLKASKAEVERLAIDFADWLDSLSPINRVSVWSKSGEHNGLFSMDNEQLFEKFKREITKEK